LDLFKNYSTAWSHVIVETLVSGGVVQAYVSPGYRDAPMIAALTANPKVTTTSCIDERAAGYLGLGYGRATNKPALLLCTSGTAGANYLPAVIEASQDHVPMIIITTDRPFELVYSGANQVVDQSHFYSGYCRKYIPFPAADGSLQPKVIAAHAQLLLRRSLGPSPGPVHLNLPFREPLEPVAGKDRPSKEWQDFKLKTIDQYEMLQSSVALSDNQLDGIVGLIKQSDRGVLILGRMEATIDTDGLMSWVQALGWPVYADTLSQVRWHAKMNSLVDVQLPDSMSSLAAYNPDCVIHLGQRLISKWYDKFLEEYVGEYIVVSNTMDHQDPSHTATLIQTEPMELVRRSYKRLKQCSLATSFEELENKSAILKHLIKDELDGEVFGFASLASDLIKYGKIGALFIGNSSAIRAFDSWCYDKPLAITEGFYPQVFANRGVSGIEGQLATAIGVSMGLKNRVTLVIGDVSMIHDLNSLLLLKHANVTVVIVNNNGGSIFRSLPIAAHQNLLSPWLETPHAFDFEGVAQMAAIPWVKTENRQSFENAIRNDVETSQIIEVALTSESEKEQLNSLKNIRDEGIHDKN